MIATACGIRAASLSLGAGMVLALCGCARDWTPPPGPTAQSPCPPWTSYPADPHDNADARYLGCANAANLQAMVAYPADLTRGTALGSGDGITATLAVEAFLKGKVKAFTGTGSSSAGAASSSGVSP